VKKGIVGESAHRGREEAGPGCQKDLRRTLVLRPEDDFRSNFMTVTNNKKKKARTFHQRKRLLLTKEVKPSVRVKIVILGNKLIKRQLCEAVFFFT